MDTKATSTICTYIVVIRPCPLLEIPYGCVDRKLKELIEQVEKVASRSGLKYNIHQQLNDAVRMIGDDDCGIDQSIYEIGPIKRPLPSHTLSIEEWESKEANPIGDRLSKCVQKWPRACKLGFITSRDERDWDEEKTSSADRIHGGALPSSMTKAINSLLQRCRRTTAYSDQPGLKRDCESVMATWNTLEEMMRENTRTMQQAVVAQVQEYHNNLYL